MSRCKGRSHYIQKFTISRFTHFRAVLSCPCFSHIGPKRKKSFFGSLFGGTSCDCWSVTPSVQCIRSKYADPLEASLLCSFYTAAARSCSDLSHLVKTLSELSSFVPLNKPHVLID